MTTDPSLRADCSRCIGLCCIALAFDRGPSFAFDKATGEACPQLTASHACRIHDHLEPAGMSGCAAYDCLGAGQLTTAMFAGLATAASPATRRAMFRAFAVLREVQALRRALGSRIGGELLEALAPTGGWTYQRVATLDLGAIRRLVRKHLDGPARDETVVARQAS